MNQLNNKHSPQAKVKYFQEKNMPKINFGKTDIRSIKEHLIGM